jgi:hypothetical protein
MAESGYVWHTNPSYRRASFPNNICLSGGIEGQNAGRYESWSVGHDLREMNAMMVDEPHGQGECVSEIDHACNILNPVFRYVGVGLYFARGSIWLTEDFIG